MAVVFVQFALTEVLPRRASASSMTSSWYNDPTWTNSTATPASTDAVPPSEPSSAATCARSGRYRFPPLPSVGVERSPSRRVFQQPISLQDGFRPLPCAPRRVEWVQDRERSVDPSVGPKGGDSDMRNGDGSWPVTGTKQMIGPVRTYPRRRRIQYLYSARRTG